MVIMLLETIEWKISNTPIDYDFAILEMQKRVTNIKANTNKELVLKLRGNAKKNKDFSTADLIRDGKRTSSPTFGLLNMFIYDPKLKDKLPAE
mgnify:CR=1 FL=1